jgi:hypothetical protein
MSATLNPWNARVRLSQCWQFNVVEESGDSNAVWFPGSTGKH